MRPESLLRFVLLNGLAIGAGAIVASSCTVDYPVVAFRCNPRQSDNCPDTHFCCSDDPSAPGGDLPQFLNKNIPASSPPYFAGDRNTLSNSGMCVDTAAVGAAGLNEVAAFGCPIPCNPTWDAGDVERVCGPGLRCCQTVEIEQKDCVNDGGTWRPATGHDIGMDLNGDGADDTRWAPGTHATHQDPNGQNCMVIAAGNESVFQDCISQLTVANQRGFCMSVPFCPTAADTYFDACEILNSGGAPPPGV